MNQINVHNSVADIVGHSQTKTITIMETQNY